MIEIRQIDKQHSGDINIQNEPFELFGKMIPSLENGKWGYDILRFPPEETEEMCFPDENYCFDDMTDSVFLGAYDGEKCVGLAVLQPGFFKYMYLYDLKVDRAYRGRHIGKMLIDAAKGVEQQTIKLFQVCRKRNIPIFTFVNKLDRAGKNPFDLMDEIETVLGIRACPMNWPIGTDGDFKGVYHRETGRVELFSGGNHGQSKVESVTGDALDPQFASLLGEYHHNKLIEDIELLDAAGDEFDIDKVLSGKLTPMFFGSAMNNFGVQPFLEKFLEITAPPTPRESDSGIIDPESSDFSGFIFKIQANMNPAHRDRIAFMRICSGKFEKGMTVKLARTGKDLKLAQPQQFMAQERESVEEAYAGDIIGLFDPGVFALGDTVYTGRKIAFAGIPVFAPEHFARIKPVDTMKRKQFLKGITQLAQEGAIQIFKDRSYSAEEIIVGVVGVLQFEVLEHRLRTEYNVEISSQQLPFRFIRWLPEGTETDKIKLSSSTKVASDLKERPVVLFENDWSIRWAEENNKGLILSDISER